MIDLIKFEYFDPDMERLKDMPGTDWKTTRNDAGEITKKHCYLGKMFLEVKATHKGYRLKVENSIHKHCCSGSNSGDFHYTGLVRGLNDLCNTLDLDPFDGRLFKFEFGVNIMPEQSPQTYISTLLHARRKMFEPMSGDGRAARGLHCTGDKRRIKVYEKGTGILRVEVRAEKMAFVQAVGVRCLADLMDKEKLAFLMHMLIEQYQSIEKTEYLDTDKMTEKEIIRYKEFKYRQYWDDLNKEDKAKGQSQFRSQKSIHRDLISEYRITDSEAEIVELIEAKACELLDISLEQFRSFKPTLQAYENYEKTTKIANLLDSSDQPKMSKVTNLIDGSGQAKMSKVTNLPEKVNSSENVESHPLLTSMTFDITNSAIEANRQRETDSGSSEVLRASKGSKIESYFDAFTDLQGRLLIPTPMANTYTVYSTVEEYNLRKQLPTFQPKDQIDINALVPVVISKASLFANVDMKALSNFRRCAAL